MHQRSECLANDARDQVGDIVVQPALQLRGGGLADQFRQRAPAADGDGAALAVGHGGLGDRGQGGRGRSGGHRRNEVAAVGGRGRHLGGGLVCLRPRLVCFRLVFFRLVCFRLALRGGVVFRGVVFLFESAFFRQIAGGRCEPLGLGSLVVNVRHGVELVERANV